MARTITNSSVGITLTSGNNPVTVIGTITGSVDGAPGSGSVAPKTGGVLYGSGGGVGDTWTITNSGTIFNSATAQASSLVLGREYDYVSNGLITNLAGGLIKGTQGAISIEGPGASVTNAVGGTILAVQGLAIGIYGAPGTVDNSGVISALGDKVGSYYGVGVELYDGGSVINRAGATIHADRFGVYIGGAYANPGVYNPGSAINSGTLNNAGTIIATQTAGSASVMAVYFGSRSYSVNNRVITNPGAVFVGRVGVGGGVLELASGGSTGTITGIGSQYTNASTLQFDTGARWKVIGDTSANSLGGVTISGFAANDTIDLTGFLATSVTFASNLLTLTNGSNQHTTLHVAGSFTSGGFHVSAYDVTGTTLIDCFASGTHIATPLGTTRVEDLAEGETVLAHFAGSAPVQWIGRRYVDCTRHPEPHNVWPVRVVAGAFGPGLPVRDLLLSPNHAVHVEDVLIPVRLLMNGTSITQMPVDHVTYYHIELAEHDLMSAEGILAESYLNAGDRANFANGGEPVRLHPDFATRPDNVAAMWEMNGCAPLILRGPQLDAARNRVNRMEAGLSLTVVMAA